MELHLARLRAHRANIQRYKGLLRTKLTELERNYVLRRLREEQESLQALEACSDYRIPQLQGMTGREVDRATPARTATNHAV
jgi:hypothetical protein